MIGYNQCDLNLNFLLLNVFYMDELLMNSYILHIFLFHFDMRLLYLYLFDIN